MASPGMLYSSILTIDRLGGHTAIRQILVSDKLFERISSGIYDYTIWIEKPATHYTMLHCLTALARLLSRLPETSYLLRQKSTRMAQLHAKRKQRSNLPNGFETSSSGTKRRQCDIFIQDIVIMLLAGKIIFPHRNR